MIKLRNTYSEIIAGITGEEIEIYGETILLYQDVTKITYAIIFNDPSIVKLEFTTSTIEEIELDSAYWFESNEINSNIMTTIDAPNAIRIKNLGEGEIYFSLRCNR